MGRVTIITLLTLSVASCATTTTWEGFTDQERDQWSAIGANQAFASELKQAGFSPNDAAAWRRLGFTPQSGNMVDVSIIA